MQSFAILSTTLAGHTLNGLNYKLSPFRVLQASLKDIGVLVDVLLAVTDLEGHGHKFG